MGCGILTNHDFRQLFERINNSHWLCAKCREERSLYKEQEMKGNPKSFSNLIPGFSSEKLSSPIDVLVITKVHGGAKKEQENDWFHPQRSLDDEVLHILNFYRELPDKSYHQQQIRLLIEKLNALDIKWAFTDLMKCFIYEGAGANNNRKIATLNCRGYLENQISLLQPRTIIGLGGFVREFFTKLTLSHGASVEISLVDRKYKYIHSIFPSGRTADDWVAEGEWIPIISNLI